MSATRSRRSRLPSGSGRASGGPARCRSATASDKAPRPLPSAAMTNVTTTRLADLADEYWQTFLAFSPVSATSIGDRRFDDRMDDPSPEGIRAHRRLLATFRERAEAIEPGALDAADAVTRSALIAQVASDVAGL